MFDLPLLDKILNCIMAKKKKYLLGDKLNCIITPAVLLIFSIVISTKQQIGSPINCIAPQEFNGWVNYVENVCFLGNVYHFSTDQYLPLNMTQRNEKSFGYYSWIPFMLLLQAILFHYPIILWELTTNKTVINLQQISQESGITNPEIECLRRSRIYYTTIYFAIRILYIINICTQFYILTKFFKFNYLLWGYTLLVRENIDYFPYINYCDFYMRTIDNSIQTYSVQCFFSINLLNKFIFIFIWIWFIFLYVVNLYSILHLGIKFTYRYRMYIFKKYFKGRHSRKFACNFISADLFLLFLFVEHNENFLYCNNFCRNLYTLYENSQFNSDIV